MKFKVVSPESASVSADSAGDPQERIKGLLAENPVFLFMKGTPDMPQCGFSAKVTEILRSWKVPFDSFNVLSDQDIREGVKDFANWPTIPQLYVNQQFVGGCDIITELSENGELLPLFKEAYPDQDIQAPPPPAEIKVVSPEEAASRLKSETGVRFLDVRTPEEWRLAHVEGAKLVDQELVEEMLAEWDRNTPLMVMCHHGQRSYEASRFFTAQGFQDVSNIDGGIALWSQTVDPSIPQY